MGKDVNKANGLENLTKDELLKLIGESGLDIRKVAREAKAVKEMDLDKEKEKHARKASEPVFKVEIKNWPDLVISRTTPRAVKTMVIMPSCESFYIKTVVGSKESIDKLDENTYSLFMRDAKNNGVSIGDDFWISRLESGKTGFQNLHFLVSEPTLSEMLRQRVILSLVDRPHEYRYYGDGLTRSDQTIYKMYEDHKLLFDKAARIGLHYRNDIRMVFRCLCDIENVFGHDNAIDFTTEIFSGKNSKDYMVAGRRMGLFMVAFSLTSQNSTSAKPDTIIATPMKLYRWPTCLESAPLITSHSRTTCYMMRFVRGTHLMLGNSSHYGKTPLRCSRWFTGKSKTSIRSPLH